MTKKKIKVLDIIPENNENTPINDDVEAVKETEIIEEKQEETVEEPQEIQPEQTQEEPQQTSTEIVDKEETTKTREQQLRQCPKCQKWLTPKTLRYFHECTKNDTVKAKRRPHKKIEVKDIEDIEDTTPPPMPVKLMRQTNQPVDNSGSVNTPSDGKGKTLPSPSTPKLPKKIDYTPKTEISYEDMRKQRIKERISQRAVKISNLFSNAV